FERARAHARVVAGDAGHPGLSPLARFDGCIINAASELNAEGLRPDEVLLHSGKPGLLVGSRKAMINHAMNIAAATCDFVVDPWEPEDLLFRAYRVCLHSGADAEALTPAAARDGLASVLIADDDATTAMLMTAMLKSLQMSSDIARDGIEALRLARELRPDVMLLDLQMPEMEGFEVLAALRNDPKTRTMPIILLTASHAETDIARGFALGADDFVTKPFHPLEMMARIRRLLRPSRGR
ncbi:MAG: response regulator transcription factor, partial [Candidatus Binataceae bacterium]